MTLHETKTRAALLAALVLCAGCTDDGGSREEDLIAVEDVADARPDADGTSDTADACAGARHGEACASEGVSCGGCGPTSCTFCNVLLCSDGQWQGLEAHPDPQCHLERCSPLDASSCPADEGCYWDDALAIFTCLPAGSATNEVPCAAAGDCAPGRLCLTRSGQGSAMCYQACRPELDDGICGGPCDAMGEHGYDNGAGRPIGDVGFCYFLGG